MSVNSNLTDGITLMFGSLIPGTIAAFMTPPIVYYIAFSICVIVLGYVIHCLAYDYVEYKEEFFDVDPLDVSMYDLDSYVYGGAYITELPGTGISDEDFEQL